MNSQSQPDIFETGASPSYQKNDYTPEEIQIIQEVEESQQDKKR